MKQIFHFSNYREYLDYFSKENKISHRYISEKTRIHASYFSRVMVGHADFSSEQIHRIGSLFNLSKEELEYFLLLREYDSTSDHVFKNFLNEKIVHLQKENLRLDKRLQTNNKELLSSEEKINLYYSEPLTAKVLMLLTIEKFQKDRFQIAKKLLISEHKLAAEIKKLHQLGLIQITRERIVPTDSFIHLDESHPISYQNHINWRIEALTHLKKQDKNNNDYSLSVCFSADEDSKIQIRELFKQFIIAAQKVVGKVQNPAELYFMNFDLF